jgi:hypothetical protein
VNPASASKAQNIANLCQEASGEANYVYIDEVTRFVRLRSGFRHAAGNAGQALPFAVTLRLPTRATGVNSEISFLHS